MRKKLMGAITIAAALVITLTSCVAGGQPSGQSGSDKIIIGIKYDQPGLGFQDGATFKGFDVDVARYVAKEMGFQENQIEWKRADSAQRETLLETGQVKMIFATYSITDTRKERVGFAGPYLVAGQSLLVKTENTDITSQANLVGKNLCSVTGSTPAEKIQKEYPQVKLQRYDSYSKCVEALAAGRVDAVTTDDSILAGFAAQPVYAGKLKVVGQPFTEEKYGVGIKKGDADTCNKVNAALKKMVDAGDWQKTLDANLGSAKYQPNPATNPPKTFEACS